jgi:hypothetical protein
MQTMEEVSESWIEVMTTNGNGPNELNSKELLRAIVVMMHAH